MTHFVEIPRTACACSTRRFANGATVETGVHKRVARSTKRNLRRAHTVLQEEARQTRADSIDARRAQI